MVPGVATPMAAMSAIFRLAAATAWRIVSHMRSRPNSCPRCASVGRLTEPSGLAGVIDDAGLHRGAADIQSDIEGFGHGTSGLPDALRARLPRGLVGVTPLRRTTRPTRSPRQPLPIGERGAAFDLAGDSALFYDGPVPGNTGNPRRDHGSVARLHHRVGHYLVLLAGGACLFLWNLGGANLWDVDEGRNARAAYEMYESGNYIVPTFNGQLRADKPALLYWLQAIAYHLFGVSEFAARLPSALAALATVLAGLRTRPHDVRHDGRASRRSDRREHADAVRRRTVRESRRALAPLHGGDAMAVLARPSATDDAVVDRPGRRRPASACWRRGPSAWSCPR